MSWLRSFAPSESSRRDRALGSKIEVMTQQELERLLSDGPPDPEAMQRLEALTKLRDISAMNRKARRPLWPIALAFVLTLGLTTFLAFAQVPASTVQLQIKTRAIQFSPTSSAEVVPRLVLGQLEILKAQSLRLEGDPAAQQPTPPAGIRALTGRGGDADISLAAVMIPRGTTAGFRLDPQGSLVIDVPTRPGNAVEATLRGVVEIETAGAAPRQVRFDVPTTIAAYSGPTEPVRLRFTAPPQRGASFLSGAPIGAVAFEDGIAAPSSNGQATFLPATPIVEGVLKFDDEGKLKTHLGRGEAMRVRSFHGLLRSVDLEGGLLNIDAVGHMEGLEVRGAGNWQPRMPTYLDYLRAHHQLPLIWGSCLYGFGIIAGLLRWLKWID